MLKDLDQIVLTADLPEHGLKAGDIGLIVHVYGAGQGYEVEFVTVSGALVALVFVSPDHVRPLEPDEIATARRVHSA